MSVKERLETLIKYLGISTRQFEVSIGVSNGYVRNAPRTINDKIADKIVDKYSNVCRVWLLTGEGEMLKTNPDERTPQPPIPQEATSELLLKMADTIQSLQEEARLEREESRKEREESRRDRQKHREEREQLLARIDKQQQLIDNLIREGLGKEPSKTGTSPDKAPNQPQKPL